MRQILRRHEVVADEWRYASELAPGAAATSAAVIVPFADLRARPQDFSHCEKLGVRIAPADKVEDLADLLPRIQVVVVEFPGPSEGRGYTSARLLRERFHYTGELRAVGAVKQDQIFFLARCGFDAFELAAGESLEAAQAALTRFTVAYQTASDRETAPHLR